jgi:hypothetical protein
MAKKRFKNTKLVIRGRKGPSITLKKHPTKGYEIRRKYFMAEPELVGSVRKDEMYGLWCAFKHDPEKQDRGIRTMVYAKGGKTRKAAVAALLALL